MSNLDLDHNPQEGMLELKDDNEFSTTACKDLINKKLHKIDSSLLKLLAETLNHKKDSHEKGWQKAWANAFVKAGWHKAL
ncbi:MULTISPECIES: hypothetical protein [unclassified Rickettsia]|uniref:hypothetical protein n=1 Tax=unclassified Rickettsia TaxID=114295 RepID=UPI003132AAE3